MANKLHLDEATNRIMGVLLDMPPKPHEEMRLGKPKRKAKKSPKQPVLNAD